MRKHQDGSAMILVMCVLVMMVAIGLTMLQSSALLITSKNHSLHKEQCRMIATSISDVMIEEIEKFRYNEDSEQKEEMTLQDILSMIDGQSDPSFTLSHELLPGETTVTFSRIEPNLHLEVVTKIERVKIRVVSCFRPEWSGDTDQEIFSRWVYHGEESGRSAGGCEQEVMME